VKFFKGILRLTNLKEIRKNIYYLSIPKLVKDCFWFVTSQMNFFLALQSSVESANSLLSELVLVQTQSPLFTFGSAFAHCTSFLRKGLSTEHHLKFPSQPASEPDVQNSPAVSGLLSITLLMHWRLALLLMDTKLAPMEQHF